LLDLPDQQILKRGVRLALRNRDTTGALICSGFERLRLFVRADLNGQKWFAFLSHYFHATQLKVGLLCVTSTVPSKKVGDV
jgi:hypothetical protein